MVRADDAQACPDGLLMGGSYVHDKERRHLGCDRQGSLWHVLAYLGREQIAETLSSVAVKEIIGVVLAYAIKSVLENLSKNNHWPDKPDPIAPAAEEETADQPSNDL